MPQFGHKLISFAFKPTNSFMYPVDSFNNCFDTTVKFNNSLNHFLPVFVDLSCKCRSLSER